MKKYNIIIVVIVNLLLIVNIAYSAADSKGADSTRMMIPDMKQSTIEASQERDDHGEAAKAATSITPNSIISGAFHDLKDVDSFKVELPAAGTLTVFTLSKIDTEGTLEDRYSSLVWENDGGSDDNFLISEYLEAGVYYISVSSGAETSDATYFLVSEFTSDDPSLDAQARRLLEINRERVTANLREIRELEKLNQSLMDRSTPSSDLHGFDRELPQGNLQNDPCPDPRDCESGAGGFPWNRYGSQSNTSSPLPSGLDPRGVAGFGGRASPPRSWDPPPDAFTIEDSDGTRYWVRGPESWYNDYDDGGAPVYRSDTDDVSMQITWGRDGKRTGSSVTYHEDEEGFYTGHTEEEW